MSVTLSEELGYSIPLVLSLMWLIFIHLDNKKIEHAEQYLPRLKQVVYKSTGSKGYARAYLLVEAKILLARGRSRNRAKAEEMLKQITEDTVVNIELHIMAIVSLCDYLLEELNYSDDPDILKELNMLISQLITIAEDQHSSSWITEGKLLQAKLAITQMELDRAKALLTQAQQIAETRGLNLLAQKISSEHDHLLKKVDEWDKLKKQDAPMVDRIELASFDGVINRLQGKRVVDPPELADEEPILLLIMDNSGVSYFNHAFSTDWDHSDLFSSFMSAFNTFSSEIFSKSIDRIRIGDNTILINPVEPFLACYVIKGQSYPALQKLTRFTEAIKENTEIWQALNKSSQTSEMIELDNPPILKTVINEIFAP
jgi:predicted nucleic-acid-binding protein